MSSKLRHRVFASRVGALVATAAPALTPVEPLGKLICCDTNLSTNAHQACASCHTPAWGWTGPDCATNAAGAVYEDSVPGRFGNPKPPSAAYATPSPILFYLRQAGGMLVRGNSWDGRAIGEKLGNPAPDRAQGPFLNRLEQALPDADAVITWVCGQDSGYADQFLAVWGAAACDVVAVACDYVALSIPAYEASPEVNAFSSKYDASLARLVRLTPQERDGLALCNGQGQVRQVPRQQGRQPAVHGLHLRQPGGPEEHGEPVLRGGP